MALNESTVDVFLAGLSQIPGDRSGVPGRITDLKNGLATHYDPGRGIPRRIKVQQRNGFRTLPVTGHSSITGNTSNPAWANPELLSSIGNQLLSVANAIPRVWDGSDFTHYSEERVVSNRLSQSVFHTSQRTLAASDDAWKSGVTCSVWDERPNPNNTNNIIYVGFKSDDGAWVRTPQIIYDPDAEGDGLITSAKVVADSVAPYFWVVFARLVTGDEKFNVKLFDLNGKQVDSKNVVRNQVAAVTTAWFDIVALDTGGCLLAQPLHTTQDNTDGVTFSSFTQTAGTIAIAENNDAAIHCLGKLAWATNELGDGFCYLETVGASEAVGRIWGYQIDPTDTSAFTHEYDFGIEAPVLTTFDSLAGYTSEGNDPDEPRLAISFTLLQTQAATVGPQWDPQLRYSRVYECTWDNFVTFFRQNDYTCQVSRAFKHDDEWYTINYYQSGSGRLLNSTTLAVDFTPGDYMTGPKEQPIEVVPGDSFAGPPQTITATIGGGGGYNIVPSTAQGAQNIDGGGTADSVVSYTPASPVFTFYGYVPTLLKWTLKNQAATDATIIGGRLVISNTASIVTARGTWEIATIDGTSIYTLPVSTNGGTTSGGNFTTVGTSAITSMTMFFLPGLNDVYDLETAAFLPAGTMTISGAGAPNDGAKTIQTVASFNMTPSGPVRLEGIRITTGSEVLQGTNFVATITTTSDNDWGFANGIFSDVLTDVPHRLIIENSSFDLPHPGTSIINTIDNDGDSAILDVPSIHVLEIEATAGGPRIYRNPLPKATIHFLDDVTPFTFFLQDVTPDYTFKGALIIVTNDSFIDANNAVYQIIGIDPDPTHHIVYAVPTDGRTDYKSQSFFPDDQSISIVFQTNVSPEFQPCWLMVPLTGTKPVVGRFEYGIAYADWRFEGNSPPNLFPGCLASVVQNAQGKSFVLPYRAISFTVGQSIATASGQTVNAAVASGESTVGLKQFVLNDTCGNATGSSNQLLLPGPMCGEFTASGFSENGINFGFEAPFLVSQQQSSSGTGLQKGGSYQVVAVGEVSDEDGDRIFTIVSPPLDFQLTGDNNSVTYGIRLIQPFDTDGVAVDKHFGVTNRKLVGISFYRTAYRGATPTTDHFKITVDLNVNGLAPINDNNDSGFSFPDEFTANYLDENIDAAILPQEQLYTDKGFLPRFPAPAQSDGDFWKGRSWVVGYDGAIWMSGEKREGDAIWFFPTWRVVLPTTDRPVAVAEMDDYLIIGCEKSMWYLPSAQFPNATGREGTIPQPVQLPFSNGCTGHMVTLRHGVAYSSTAGGVWLITRQLTNEWLSQNYQDDLTTITGLSIDEKQRLKVATGSSLIFVYDQVVQLWSKFPVPSDNALKISTLQGETVFEDDDFIWLYDPTIFYDNVAGSLVGVPPDITVASWQFGNVRNLKALWAIQAVGTYKGEHHINAVLSYPDDDPDNATVFPKVADGPYTPDPDLPYLLEMNPKIEQASSYGMRIFADFDGITTPGDSFELELFSCQVGIDPSGQNKFPNNRRIRGG